MPLHADVTTSPGDVRAVGGGERPDGDRPVALSADAVIAEVRAHREARLARLTAPTGWLSLVVPILVAAPAYFGGDLSLGGLIMVAGAFAQVQGAMRWFVDNFSRLADWRAALHRVARFR